MSRADVLYYAQAGSARARLDLLDGSSDDAEAVCEVPGCGWSTVHLPWRRDLAGAAEKATEHLRAEHR